MNRTEEFSSGDHGLVPVRMDTSAGFAFVTFDDDIAPMSGWHGDLPRLHRSWGLEDLVSTRRREFEVGCNWKSFQEVFNEYYHLPAVHRDSIDDLYDLPEEPDETLGNCATQFGTTRGSGALLGADQSRALPLVPGLRGENRLGVRYTWMFPNMTSDAGTESVWVYEAYTIAPDRTRVGMTACFPAETTAQPDFDGLARHYYERLDAAMDEDIPALESQYRGLDSPLARPGRYSWLEANVASFAGWYAGRALDPGPHGIDAP